MVTCAQCGQVNPEIARFCLSCGTPLSGTPETPSATTTAEPVETRKTVTVMFCDVVGSTGFGEVLDPESVRTMMSTFFAEARSIVEAQHGTVEKFIGDAVVAAFGLEVLREDDAQRAVRAAVQLREALATLNRAFARRWGLEIAVRIGVNTGEVVVGDPTRGPLFTGGDTTNVAARLEQAAGPGDILIGDLTRRLLRHLIDVERVGPLDLKGRRAPVLAWRVTRLRAPAEGTRSFPGSALVGRGTDLAALEAAFEQVTSLRRCRLTTVVGAPGVGKSRLVNEYLSGLGSRASVAKGRCLPYGEGITFWPAAEAVRALLDLDEGAALAAARAELEARLPPDAAPSIVDGVLGVLGLGPPVPREETFWALRSLLEACAERRPLVLVVDDLHWAEATLIDFVEYLPQWCDSAAVQVLVVGRPELVGMRPSLFEAQDDRDCLRLGPLSSQETQSLAEDLLGGPVDPEVVAHVVSVSEGNPLFAAESLRMLLDDALLGRPDGVWRRVDAQLPLTVPPTIQALLSARLDRLGGDERIVIERASVVGRQFMRQPVAELAPARLSGRLDEHLAALVGKQLVSVDPGGRAEGHSYRFTHMLIRDAAYERLLKHERATLHERLADWVEARPAGASGPELEDLVGYHLEQACRYRRELGRADDHGEWLQRRAATQLRSTAQRAMARADYPAAVSVLERARRLTSGPDRQQLEILLALVDCSIAVTDLTRAAEVLALLDAAAATADLGPAVGARIEVAACALRMLSRPETRLHDIEVLHSAIAVLESAADDHALARAHTVLGRALALVGRLADAESQLDRALLKARSIGDPVEARQVLLQVPPVALWGPQPVVKAVGRLIDTLRVLRLRPGNRLVEAEVLRCMAPLEAMRGRPDAARTVLASARAIATELGHVAGLAECHLVAGVVELIAEQPDRARPELELAGDGFAGLGVASGSGQAAGLLAQTWYRLGEPARAAHWVGVAERCGTTDSRHDAVWLAVRAKLVAEEGDPVAAEHLARRAVALVERTDALVDHADALMDLADVLRMTGRVAQAETHERAAKGLYDVKGHVVGSARAARR